MQIVKISQSLLSFGLRQRRKNGCSAGNFCGFLCRFLAGVAGAMGFGRIVISQKQHRAVGVFLMKTLCHFDQIA
ncbi:hypothetical protein JJM18_003749 [Salmonella enterica]|nr:hypothetical protein [Salmonella enterica]